MIHSLSVDIADQLIRSGLPADKKEVYVYGLECSLNLIISDSILLAYAFYMGQIPELLLWLICFSLLRTHVGGYHAPSHFLCILGGIFTGILCLRGHSILYDYPNLTAFLLIICAIFIWKCAPITSPFRAMSKNKQKKEHHLSVFIFISETICSLLLYYFSPTYTTAIISSILASSIFAIIGYFHYHKDNDSQT